MNSTGPLSLKQTATRLLAAMDEGEKSAVVVVISHPDQKFVGGRLFFRGGKQAGSLQNPSLDDQASDLAARGLSGDPGVLPGLHRLSGATGSEVTIYLELHHPPAELVIVGAGHLAQPLCSLGALLGLTVRILDDRPDFATMERFPEAAQVSKVDFGDPFAGMRFHPWSHVLLVTRGHRYDYECLRRILEHVPLPGYIGMIGSRRRVRATFEALLEEGFSRGLLSQVHAPIGLDIGGQTPAEIAVSVAAELVHSWRGGSCLPMREVERVLDRLTTTGQQSGSGEREEGYPSDQ
jgi:xanthine dehydrogenase accessory factor